MHLHAPAAPEGAPDARIEILPDHDLGPGEVTLAVGFSSLNYKDALVLADRNGVVRDYPRIPGIDLVGTVLRSADALWRVGDAVIATGWASA
ncbi:MAG: hypothetical protein M3Y67_10195 [Pseudomonadota bacterium]|nr:hypothetical protein [Pseudomonadota bacterium]